MMLLLQLLANGFVSGCNTALLALSFALIYNTTRTFHIAHGAVYTAAAYICYALLIQQGWTLIVSLILALLLSAALGVAMELIVYAPLVRRNATPLVGLLSSLGLYVALVNLIALFFGNDTKLLSPGVEKVYHLGQIVLTRVQLLEIAAASVLLPLFVLLLNLTTSGKIIRAVRDYPSLASLVGINVPAVRLSVFALGSALAGVAAVLAALDVGVDPQAGMPVLLTAAVALIVGGVGTFEGPVVGGFILGLLQGVIVWFISARWNNAITFAVLIIFMLFRPAGLAGRRRRLEESWE
jgi:branched-chain amino acid transport system permease protein